MWANWVPASIGTGVPSPHRSATSMRVIAASWRLVNVAPAGSPVVPDVNTTTTGRSGSGGSSGRSRPSPSATSRATSSADEMTTAGSTTSRQARRSGSVSRGLTPAVTAPALAAPR